MKSMRVVIGALVLAASAVLLAPAVATSAEAKEGGPAPPPAQKIPGINAEDPFPQGCVGCHINYVDMKMDTRFATLLKKWGEKVEPGLLAKAQGAAPEGVTLTGKHPAATSALSNVPEGCLKCHGKTSKKAPLFSRLIHRIHLVGGEENHYMTVFQGQCTYCHKFDSATGAWSSRSGPEK